MADRKQFLKQRPVDAELARLVAKSREQPATDEELHEQRISFAYGNAPMSDEKSTKESVRRASAHIRMSSA